jgi:hypothetical protein
MGRTRKSAVSDSAAKRSEIPATIDPTRTTRLRVSAKRNQRRRVRRRWRNRRSSLAGAVTGGGRLSCGGGSKYVMLREYGLATSAGCAGRRAWRRRDALPRRWSFEIRQLYVNKRRRMQNMMVMPPDRVHVVLIDHLAARGTPIAIFFFRGRAGSRLSPFRCRFRSIHTGKVKIWKGTFSSIGAETVRTLGFCPTAGQSSALVA